jgi:hypothetical protein
MGLLNWFKSWGNAIQVVNALDGSIKQFPNIDSKKLQTLLKTKSNWNEKDTDIINKRIIDGYDQKINSENVENLGAKYLDFYQTIFPDKNGQEIISKINCDKVECFIFTKIKNDEILDPNEIDEIIKYSNSLSVSDYNSIEKIRKDYDYYITNWELDNGVYRSLPSDFIIQKNEVCIYRLDNCELLERKTITKRVSYSGLSSNIRIMKGLSYRVGSYNVASQKETVDISKGKGVINVTSKRVMFKGLDGATTINNSTIVDIQPYSDAVVITKSTGKPLTIKTKDAIRLYQYLRAATRH